MLAYTLAGSALAPSSPSTRCTTSGEAPSRSARTRLAICFALAIIALGSEPALATHDGIPSSVSLVAEKSEVTVPESIKLTATADRHLYGSGRTVVIVDEEGRNNWSACNNTETCVKYASNPWSDNPNPQPRHFHAELRGPDGGVLATSAQVTVDVRKFVWNVVSVVANPLAQVVPGSVQFVATVDASVYATGYQIYIIDDDTGSFSKCSSGAQCSRWIARNWGDNVNPQPARVHVEVRGPGGDVAGSSAQFEAPFRRFLFAVGLWFSTETDANGNIVHKATATAHHSVYATGYRLKIKAADGSEVCSASSGTQCGPRTVTVGQTYRAVVERSGHVAGQSDAVTLTDSGPQLATVGDIDLAALATAAGGVDICTRLGLSPYRTDVVGPSTSAGDQWEACAAAVAAGAGTLAILRAVAETPGGEANLYWLQGDVTKEAPAPDTESSSDDAKAPRPLPFPLLPDVQKLADALMQKQTIDQGVADDIAAQCSFLHWRAGKSPGRCKTLPIFASGSDVAEATEHDLAALAGHWSWLVLNREQSSTKPGSGWQSTGGRCTPNELRACHEYPFFGTEQGGPLGYLRGAHPIIGLVLRDHNSLQGTRYSQFIAACNMKTGTPDPTGAANSTGGDPFLSIPLPPDWPRPTLWLCNGKTE